MATFAAGSVSDAGVSVTAAGASLGDPVVVVPSNATAGSNSINSYNPSFAPDSTFLVYSQTICATGDAKSAKCDSDIESNVSATTWAVKPVAGATPIHLDNGGAGGSPTAQSPAIPSTRSRATDAVSDGAEERGSLWFTVASLRQPGLRRKDFDPGEAQQQLWMFAVDPAKIAAGRGRKPTRLPLRSCDPKTSNHIAEWTQKIVGGNPPAPVPPPPPPPPPPAPPAPK